MAEFVVVLSAWREGELVKRALDQVVRHVDRVVLSACRFIYVENLPDDGMVGMARDYCNSHGVRIDVDEHPDYEFEVKTRALRMVGHGNYCFFFDADEIITGDMRAGVSKIKAWDRDVYGIGCEGFNLVTETYEASLMQRVWKVSPGDHFVDNHWTVYDGDRPKLIGMNVVCAGYTHQRIPDFRVVNQPNRRSADGQLRRLLRYSQLRDAGWDERKARTAKEQSAKVND